MADERPARLSADRMEAWRGMLRTHATLMRRLGQDLEERHGMSISEYDVLRALVEAPGRRLPMGGLADAVYLTPSGITRLIDRLVDRGWVTRDADDLDGRRSQAVLSAEGLAAWRLAGRTHLDGLRTLFVDRLDDDEVAMLVALWTRLDDTQDAPPGPPRRPAGPDALTG